MSAVKSPYVYFVYRTTGYWYMPMIARCNIFAPVVRQASRSLECYAVKQCCIWQIAFSSLPPISFRSTLRESMIRRLDHPITMQAVSDEIIRFPLVNDDPVKDVFFVFRLTFRNFSEEFLTKSVWSLIKVSVRRLLIYLIDMIKHKKQKYTYIFVRICWF